MASANPKPASHSTAADSTKAVDELMLTLDHPFKAEIEILRSTILGVDPTIAEGIKWKAPSFRTTEYFATTNLRAQGGIGIILHLGAKVREVPSDGVLIQDPEGLLKWLAKDRAMIVFADREDLLARKAALEDIIRHWITHV